MALLRDVPRPFYEFPKRFWCEPPYSPLTPLPGVAPLPGVVGFGGSTQPILNLRPVSNSLQQAQAIGGVFDVRVQLTSILIWALQKRKGAEASPRLVQQQLKSTTQSQPSPIELPYRP